MKPSLCIVTAAAACVGGVGAFNAFAPLMTKPKPVVKNVESKMPMFEYLKFDKNPKFDVLSKTQEYVESQQIGNMSEEWYAEDYALRGPVVGPVTRKDLKASQSGLGLLDAFPDI